MGLTPFSDGLLTNVLAGTSSVCWMAVYLVAIRTGFREKTFCVPVEALALNVAWEFLFGFVWTPDAPPYNILQMWVNRAWCVFDVFIVATCLLYGASRMKVPRRDWRNYVLTALAAAFAVLGAFYLWTDHGYTLIVFQSVSAFVMNVLMSALFIRMFWKNPDQPLSLAVAKGVGTAAVTAVYLLSDAAGPDAAHYPVIWVCGIACLVLDGMYVKGIVDARRAA